MNINITLILILIGIVLVNIMSNKYSTEIKTFYKTPHNFQCLYCDTKQFFWKNMSIIIVLIIVDVFFLYQLVHLTWG